MRARLWCQIRYWRANIAGPRAQQILGSAHQTLHRTQWGSAGQISYLLGSASASTSAHVIHEASNIFSDDIQDAEIARILGRAPHGIDSLERLDFEADVGHVRAKGSRLIDLPVNRHDLELWLVLLDYRILKDGKRGVYDVIQGMKFRGPIVKLLENEEVSNRIWDLCLSTALQDDDVLFTLCYPSGGIAADRTKLFFEIVSALLRAGKPQQAENAAAILRTSHFRGEKDLSSLVELLLDHDDKINIGDFCAIHHRLPYSPIYDTIVPALWKAGRDSDAIWMHSYLLAHQDYPRKFDHLEPFILNLARRNKSITPLIRELETCGISYSHQSRKLYASSKARTLANDNHEFRSPRNVYRRTRQMKDEFVAKIFATQSLSFEFAISSLMFFGLAELGPLAIREIAMKARNPQALAKIFQRLGEVEIDTGSSLYVQLLRNLCQDNRSSLLKSILASDQHHDVFEDRETQTRLLTEHYRRKDWPQVNLALAILSRGKFDPSAQRQSQRLLLKSAIVVRDWRGALMILSNMQRSAHSSTRFADNKDSKMTLNAIVQMIITPGKKVNHTADNAYLNRTTYLIGVLQELRCGGVAVGAKHWCNVLFRLGDLKMLDDLERLTLWIAQHYADPSPRHPERKAKERAAHSTEMLGNIVSVSFQAALVDWTFGDLPYQKTNRYVLSDRAKRGIHLLKVLHEKYGVPLDIPAIKTAYIARLQMKPLSSEEAFARRIRHFDAIWMEGLE